MSLTIADTPKKASNWRYPARLGYLVIFLAFGAGGAWTMLAEISSAVVAQAIVAVETNSKTVQHLEGGIVGEILVRENQHVSQGDVVLRLSNVQAKASLTTAQNQLVAAQMQEARLIAERDQKPEIALPPEVLGRENDPIVTHAIADQQAAFADRKLSLQGQIGVFESRIEGLKTEIQGLHDQEVATRHEVEFIDKELTGYHQLLDRHLIPLTQVLEKERDRTRLQGVIGRSIADQGKAQIAISETELNIQQLRHKFQEETATSILETRQKIADLIEKMSVTTDVMHRIDIRAPVSGHVLELAVHSVGQVIRGGEPLMKIVPDDEALVINAHFAPTDIDRVHRALQTEVRFPEFHARTIPVILGQISSVSSDRLVDEATHQPYYLAVVLVNKLAIPEELRDRIRAGMPAEVIAPLGYRTVLSYLVSPLVEGWHKSLREE